MTNLLVYYSDDREISFDAVEKAFLSDPRFSGIRYNEPVNGIIAADFDLGEHVGVSIVRLNRERNVLSLTENNAASVEAAWILHEHLEGPLHIINDVYDFDFDMNEFASADELWAAMLKTWEEGSSTP